MTAVNRRQFLSIVGLSAAGLAAWQLGLRPRGLAEVSAARLLMGTVVNLTVLGEDRAAAETAVSATFTRMAELESLLSRHRADSELARLNRDGRIANPSAPLREVLAASAALSELSGGAFDVTVKPLLDLYGRYAAEGGLPPGTAVAAARALVDYRALRVDEVEAALRPGMGVTLDGIAKGYVVDEGAAVLAAQGFPHVLVEAGGDLAARGATAERPWRIGLRSPRGATVLRKLALQDTAVATSGDYMHAFSADLRHHHIIDPRTGYSTPELAGVTVEAPSAMLADGLATAVMVLGAQAGLELIDGCDGCAAYVLGKDLTAQQSAGFAG